MPYPAEHAPDGMTVIEAIRRLEQEGYTAQMAAGVDGLVRCFACHAGSRPMEVHVDRICRTEGASDPADMVAVAALRCPHCGAKATAALKYGPGAPAEEADLLLALDDTDRRRANTVAGEP